MERTVLVLGAVIFVLSFYYELVFGSSKFDTLIDNKAKPNDEDKLSTWFSPRLDRMKRSSIEKLYDIKEQEVSDLLDDYDDFQYALITLNGNDKFVCKNLKGKRNNFIPRLGRNIDNDLSTGNKWLQDGENGNEYMIQRSPPFAPRLGKKNLLFVPRLGRDI